jgi:hypothetical protein
MFSLPIPFIEQGTAKTWDIQQGYELNPKECLCTSTDTSGTTVDFTAVIAKLDDILLQIEQQNVDVEQTTLFATGSSSIPAGVQSYTIINLGIDPNDPLSAANAMIIDGLSINTKIMSFGNSTDTNQVLVNPVTYDANGNTLFITYNTPI